MSRRAEDTLLPAALVLGCIVAFFVVFLPKTLVEGGWENTIHASYDYASYFLPRYWLGSQEIGASRLPLWNRYEYGGIPLLATTQLGALYPPKVLLFGFLPPVPAVWAFLIFHYLLAAFGFFGFLREEGVKGAGLFLGTALWIFGAHVLQSNYHPVRIACFSWMPLLFILGNRIAAGAGVGKFALFALVVTLQLLAGYPEFTIDLALLLVVHVTARWLQRRTALPPWKTVPILAAAFVLGSMAAGIQLVPLGELATVAHRVSVADARVSAPRIVGADSASIATLTLVLAEAKAVGRMMLLSAGAVPGLLAFAIVGCCVRPARSAAAGYLFCLCMPIGGLRLLRLLPGFNMIRFPVNWLMLGAFYFAWIAALGCEAAFRPGALSARARRVALSLVAAGSLMMMGTWLLAWRSASEGPSLSTLSILFANDIGGPTGLIFGLLGAFLIGALALLELVGRATQAWAWLGAFSVAVLGHLAAYPQNGARASFAPPFSTGQVASMRGPSPATTGRAIAVIDLIYGYEITDRLPSALGVEDSFLPWRWRQIAERLHFSAGFGVIDWKEVVTARGFWNAMNVQFFLAPTSLFSLFVSNNIFPANRRGDQTLFENPLRLGDAWVTYGVHRVGSDREALDYVMGSRFDPYREVVLESPTRQTYPTTTNDPVTIPSAGTRFSSTEVEFDVSLPRPGVFVVSESAYPGWIATVDGAKQPWLTADYVLRAVELGPGTHRVRFEYRPASVRWGTALSGVGFSGIVGLLVVARRRRASISRRS